MLQASRSYQVWLCGCRRRCGCDWVRCGGLLTFWFSAVHLQMLKFTASGPTAQVHYPLPSGPSTVTRPCTFTWRVKHKSLEPFKTVRTHLLKSVNIQFAVKPARTFSRQRPYAVKYCLYEMLHVKIWLFSLFCVLPLFCFCIGIHTYNISGHVSWELHVQ